MKPEYASTNLNARALLLRFRQVFGIAYVADDTDLPECTLAAFVANMLPVDNVWFLIVGPPSSGKTAVLGILRNLPGIVRVGTLTQGALLSGSPKRERTTKSTGGVLRVIGKRGVIVCKDFTSILSMSKDTQSGTLAALREVYDGEWTRSFGTDGGKSEYWEGKAGLIGAVTQVIDQRHAAMSIMGERFILFRLPASDDHSVRMTRRALECQTDTTEGIYELAKLSKGIVDQVTIPERCLPLHQEIKDKLVSLAFLSAQCRSAVERDGYSREIELVPYHEEPGRLVKQLAALFQSLLAIGNTDEEAWQKVRRIGLDSIPETRRRAILALKDEPYPLKTSIIAKACNTPDTTTRRVLEDLSYLGLLERHNPEETRIETWELVEKVRDGLDGVSSELGDEEPPFDIEGIIDQKASPENKVISLCNSDANTEEGIRVSRKPFSSCASKSIVQVKACSQ